MPLTFLLMLLLLGEVVAIFKLIIQYVANLGLGLVGNVGGGSECYSALSTRFLVGMSWTVFITSTGDLSYSSVTEVKSRTNISTAG